MAFLSKVAALLALALAACSSHGGASIFTDIAEAVPVSQCPPAGPYVFYPPSGFTDNEVALIQGAAAKWNLVTKSDHRITFAVTGHQRILSWPPSEDGFIGQWAVGLGTVFIRPQAVYVHEIALHELGHALGLEHIPDATAVMCSVQAAPGVVCDAVGMNEISPLDIAECRRVGACP